MTEEKLVLIEKKEYQSYNPLQDTIESLIVIGVGLFAAYLILRMTGVIKP